MPEHRHDDNDESPGDDEGLTPEELIQEIFSAPGYRPSDQRRYRAGGPNG